MRIAKFLFTKISVFRFVACLFMAALPGAIRAADPTLPDGPGKVPLQRICSACHAPEIVAGKRETKERWDEIVSSMVEKGAVGTDEEFNQIVEYLAANFGKPTGGTKSEDTKPDPKQ